MTKILYLLLGWLAFGIGFAGIFLPLLPTVVFWILAAWLFTNSAPHLRERICNHPRFGAMIRDFLDHGVLSRRGKLFAVTGMMGSVGISLMLWIPPLPILIILVVTLLFVVFWLLRRPETTSSSTEREPD